MSVAMKVEAKVKRLPRGKPLALQMFHDCGPEGAVRTALSRLVKRGELVNMARGIYARPKPNEYFGTSLPAAEEVARTIAMTTGERLAPHGAEVARRLGLSTQMPVRTAFYTTGRTRRLRVGDSFVQFEHAPEPMVKAADSPAGPALLALHHLGPGGVTFEVLEDLNERVPMRELLKSQATPAWLRKRVASLEPALRD